MRDLVERVGLPRGDAEERELPTGGFSLRALGLGRDRRRAGACSSTVRRSGTSFTHSTATTHDRQRDDRRGEECRS